MLENEPKVEEKEADRIITPGDPQRFQLLRVRSNECDLPLIDSDRDIISNMTRIMDEMGSHAFGLAAVQVGFPRRIFIMRERDNTLLTLVNPKIIHRSQATAKRNEACLSIPGFVMSVARPKNLTVEFYDINGDQHVREFSSIYAQAVCHEMDHLNGKLLDDHMAEAARKFQRKKAIRVAEKALKKEKERKKKKRKR